MKKKLSKKEAEDLIEDVDWLLDTLEDPPEPNPHDGPCTPESGCDTSCMLNALVGNRISTIRNKVKRIKE